MSDACVFCGIVAGIEPASFVHQDDLCVGFLSLHQVRPGEIALIPREHIDHFTDLPDDLAAHIMRVAQRFGRTLRSNLKPDRVGYVVHGYGVAHAHLMVIPLHDDTDITSGRLAYVKDGRVALSLSRLPPVTRAQLDELAGQIQEWVLDA